MNENIIIKITGEADMQSANSQLQKTIAQNEKLTKEMKRLDAQMKEDMQRYKQLGMSTESLQKGYERTRKATEELIAANERSIKTLEGSISVYNLVDNAQGALRTQIRNIREELSKMEMNGDTTSRAFIKLSVRAAQLEDQMGDTRQQIAILASDTKNLDAAMSLGSGVVGSFNAMTSAMALLGGESEKLQQAFLKVQAATSVLAGIQQMANVINKDSAANVVIKNALMAIEEKMAKKVAAATTAQTASTKLATIAQKALNKAMMSNPALIVISAIAALVAGYIYLRDKTKEATEEQEGFNRELERTEERASRVRSEWQHRARMAEAEGKDWKEVHEIRKQGLKQEYEEHKAQYNRLLGIKRDRQLWGQEWTDEDEQSLQQAYDKYHEYYGLLLDLNRSYLEQEAAERRKAAEAERQEELRRQQEREQQIAQAEKDLQDVRIALMEEGLNKEIAAIELTYQRKIEAIKGNSEAEINLRNALELQKQKEIQAARDKANQEELQKQKDAADALQRLREEMYVQTLSEQDKELRELQLHKNEEMNIIKQAEEQKVIDHEEALKLIAQLDELYAQKQEKIEAKYKGGSNEQDTMAIINYNTKKMQLERKTEDEIWDYRYNAEKAYWEGKLALAEVGSKEYYEIVTALADLEIENMNRVTSKHGENIQNLNDMTNEILSYAGEMASELFGIFSDNIQHQIEQLDEMYTTDAEEAKENANKKYISEKELEDKKNALKRKQAAIDKASAAFNIGLSTAMAIMRIWADVPKVDFGATTIAMTALAASLGAIQLAAVLAKPLPQYAKGRKGGKGEYALVGEKGPEVMYIPAGASIVPNSLIYSPDKWDRFGVPTMAIPPMPQVESFSELAWRGMPFDYERFGKTMRNNMPEQKMIHINIDRSGVTVQSGNDTHTYMNTKYTGTWN